MWDNLLQAFNAEKHQLITVDLPHHGKSLNSQTASSIAKMAKQLEHLLKHLGVANPTIIGHSMGGYVGLEYLRLAPAHLILLHSNFWADGPTKKNDRNRVIDIVTKNKGLFINEAIPNLFAPENRMRCEEEIRRLIKKASDIPEKDIVHATAAMRDRQESYEILRQGRVSMIHGENDPIIPTAVLNEELVKYDLHPRIEVIQKCGHMSIWENPTALIESINRLLIE